MEPRVHDRLDAAPPVLNCIGGWLRLLHRPTGPADDERVSRSAHPAAATSGSAAEHGQPFLLGLRLENEVPATGLAHGGRRLRGVEVAGEEHRIIGDLGQLLGQALVQEARIATR